MAEKSSWVKLTEKVGTLSPGEGKEFAYDELTQASFIKHDLQAAVGFPLKEVK